MTLKIVEDGYTFDDLLLIPRHSNIQSRKDPDIKTELGLLELDIPIVASPMNTVCEHKMAKTIAKLGGSGVIHRFMSVEDRIKQFKKIKDKKLQYKTFVAVGATKDKDQSFLAEVDKLVAAGVKNICVDVANGHSIVCIKAVQEIKKYFPQVNLMAGNVVSKVGASNLANSGADCIRVGVGGGCFGPGTRILMSDGSYKNIEDIKVHDKVINKDGKPVSVVGVKFSGIKKVVKYKSNLFYKKTYATPDHQHWVGSYSHIKDINKYSLRKVLDRKKENFQWKALGDCEYENATFLMPKDIEFDLPDDFCINMDDYMLARRDMNGICQSPKIQSSYELGYIFGTFSGDGCARTYKTDSREGNKRNTCCSNIWYFGKQEKHIANKLIKCIDACFGYSSKTKETKNMIKVVNRNNGFTRLLSEFDKRERKHIPPKYMCKNSEYLKGIWDGLVDSDGHIAKDGRVSLHNTSIKLIEQFLLIGKILNGYYPSAQLVEPTTGNLKNCKLENCKESYSARTVKRPKFHMTEEYQINRFYGYDDGPEETYTPTYDIEVDCPTHSFIANNVIVHNSACTTRLQTGHGMPQLTAIDNCAKIKEKYPHVSIIADGGIRNSGDAVKALAAGADCVMLGSYLAATTDAPCYDSKTNTTVYAGMASNYARSKFNKIQTDAVEEGTHFVLDVKGATKDIIEDFCKGIKTGLSYSGSNNLQELKEDALWVKITQSGYIEGTAHGKKGY